METNGPIANADICFTRREALQGIAGIVGASLVGEATLAEGEEAPNAQPGRDVPFCSDWRFHRGDAEGAEASGFNDESWRTLDVPHDWSVEDLPGADEAAAGSAIWTDGTNAARVGPFDVYASEGQISTGWMVGGIGWYRKVFQSPQIPAGGKAELRFEGVYMNPEVWLNGTKLSNHPYGYTPISFDITKLLKSGPNTLAVKVNNVGRNSRWYSGSGIFRKVWLNVTGEVRIPENGIWITTRAVSKSASTVRVETTIENGAASSKRVNILVRLLDAAGKQAAEGRATASVNAGSRGTTTCEIKLAGPLLWSPNDPQLYRAVVSLETDKKSADATETMFGIRKVEIDTANGLRVNGEPFKMRGGCVHHDNGPLGSACIPRAEERRVETLKASGYNAIRTSHNPPSRDFLDACDRFGMMVIDEAFDCWESGNKNPDDYHVYFKEWWQRDLEAMILRDRNHPSVVLWSIGNEINERAEPHGIEIGTALRDAAHKLDPTRLVTAAICHAWDHPGKTWKDIQPAFTYLDVGGYNYQWQQYAPDHSSYPQRIMVGTESFPNEAWQNWDAVLKNSFVLGDFVWTAIDYLGESGIGHSSIATGNSPDVFSPPYPWFNSYCGDIDLIGNKKPQSYFRDIVWDRSKIEMAVQRPIPDRYHERISQWGWSDELRSWTWPGHEGRQVNVRVYTKGDRVVLFVNGKQAGEKQLKPGDNLRAEFSVPYAPGELKAVAYANGAEIGSIAFKTAGKPSRLLVTPDRRKLAASRDDLAYAMVQVLDDNNNLVPDAVLPITFNVSGDGEIAAVASANPKDVASFRQPRRFTYHGTCCVIVRPKGAAGSITIRAESEGLEPASTTVDVA
jgi:beta-galactosidase